MEALGVGGICLEGQTAIVTGASTGIGRGVALALAGAGANVAVHYGSNRKAAEETAAGIRAAGRSAHVISGDFRSPQETAAAIEAAAAGLGGQLDILVNNAGSLVARVPLEEMDDRLWAEVLDLNLSSVFWATRAASRQLKPGARVVNVTSIAAHSGGGPHAFAYAAAKGGVISLTRGLARELAPRGIRVNCISPGTIDTPFHERFGTPEGLEQVRRSLPLQRLGTPEDCAGAVLYLVSPLSDFVTGETIEINGGQWFA
jgi:3-oxoacyl-[acyl-carrier protein] reductase